MGLFEFFKRILGWADEGSRKRKVSDSSDSDSKYGSSKRPCCNHTDDEDIFIDLEADTENFKMQLCSKEGIKPSSTPHLTKDSSCGRNSFPAFRPPALKESNEYLSQYDQQSPAKLNCFGDKNSSCSNMTVNSKQWNSLKTHQLQGKKQYGELLQNFTSHRINGSRLKQNATLGSRIEVIDVEQYHQSSPSHNEKRTSNFGKTFTYSRSTPLNVSSKSILSSIKINSPKNTAFTSFSNVQLKQDDGTSKSKSLLSPNICFPPSNSLRDQFACKEVLKGDYILQVAKRHNARIEQRSKEAKELEKMTHILSKHNQLVREAALEEQLTRSMRLCEAIIDDREELEEPSLPELTDSMLKEIKSAVSLRSSNEVLAEGFGLRITRKDIHTLIGLNWLNDEVINFYMNLLIARGSSDKFPTVHAMNTFFYPKLLAGGHSSLKRWTRKVDIFAQDLVVVPIHLGIHWCMSIIDFRAKTINYYDSMGGSNQKCLLALSQYLKEESLDKKKKPYNLSDWKMECVKDIPQQMNGSDCGVFSCMFAEYICGNKKITFTQEDMPYFRNKMIYEIVKGRLL
ncbi:sentrin-specific protease 1 [Orussus abietinus]|uniref:sentrin-specific protease 1 n=1 Tax=Orussus abietinus TaxID=222816 RepID=UPI0006263420|nr:sentrin-specific protease 1 [Orussus abietinus]XP_012286439.1 sentrin-specific protease 1 [Orussus abietinus]XP_012286440.1 sentrin-specific protease 1 [Orussus abietinus]